MRLNEIRYFAGYGARTFVLKQKKPLIAGMPLTDVCNLQCKHCVVANSGRGHYPFPDIDELMRHFYDIGVRILYLQGGEIMTWRDGKMDANDVVRRAHDIGFFKVASVTNGTIGLPIEADMIWISLDGSEKVHNSIRGPQAFARMMQNVRESQHRHLIFNMTINRLNACDVEAVAEMADNIAQIRGVSFNFHTPYAGVEDLCLSLEERTTVIDRIIHMKEQHLPVLNTKAGLKAMQRNRWRRPIPIIQLVEKGKIYECCWGRDEPGVCERCGYGIIAELSQVMRLSLPTIAESLSLFG